MKLKDLKRGEWFTLKKIEEPKPSQVWIKGPYCREILKFEIYNFNDVNRERFLKGDTEVFTDFYF